MGRNRSRGREHAASAGRAVILHADGRLTERLREELSDLDELAVEFISCNKPVLTPSPGLEAIVLDLSAILPEGFVVQRVLQPRSGAAPIVVARAVATVAGPGSPKLNGFEGIAALEGRLHAALGRTQHRSWLPVRFEGLHLVAQLPGTSVLVDGRTVAVSPREAELLALLLQAPNSVIPRDVIISEIWGYETRSLDVHVRHLRRKLGRAGCQIETAPGFGYRFVEPPSSSGLVAQV
ncbi:MAG: winged helix-turn-helix domain-containing protein [Vicinamibacterales bacterium]